MEIADAAAVTRGDQSASAPADAVPRRATSRRRRLRDRAASWAVTAGGLAIIISILGIFVFILIEVAPLGARARVEPAGAIAVDPEVAALVADEYRTRIVSLSLDGRLRVLDASDGRVISERPIAGDGGEVPRLSAASVPPGGSALAGATLDGRVLIVPVSWEVRYEEGRRLVLPEIGAPASIELDSSRRPLRVFAAQADPGGGAAAAAQVADGTLVVALRDVRRNPITEEVTESVARHEAGVQPPLASMVLDGERRSLYAGTERGTLIWWRLQDGRPVDPDEVEAGPSAVTALSLLIGDRALAAGTARGGLSVWFQVRRPDETFRLTRVRDFPPHPAPIVLLAPSQRGKGFLAADGEGTLGLYYSTSHRTLWTGRAGVGEPRALSYAPKGDGAYVAGRGRLAPLDVRSPHPEAGLKAFFGQVWYEGYGGREYAWQSTGGTDDFEPKLSLVPLLIGTLKGTFYSLILAIPLGVLGAMYTSQFMHPSLKRVVKPTVEIMAALPSVVLGFLAGLWLAPRLERAFPALVLMALALPALALAGGLGWRWLPRTVTGRFPAGSEVVAMVVVLAGGIWLCLLASPAFEAAAFGGSFPSWLLETTGLRYDQRNAVVVGLAMGFAVIPIIFAIAEDAFSNVPANLPSGSLALGATPWQTVTRLVLPTASPGIFSAVMIGFGRAVGETMIVVMATGNTPILDWNPFNGFRTLSANIAVEIPEAPHGGTLYRTLFLAGLLLFVLTFAVNTAAELVRQRLRRRYAEL